MNSNNVNKLDTDKHTAIIFGGSGFIGSSLVKSLVLQGNNSLFIEELKQVIKSFNMRKQPLSNFDNGEKSLRIVVRLKDSIKKKKWIKYN